MTHFSDFAYLQRCALWVYMSILLFYRMWISDRFRCLQPRRIFGGELKSVITVLYILMLLMQAAWDMVGSWIKYSEKYMVIQGTDIVVSTPFYLWNEQHKRIAQAMDYVECLNLAMQTGVLVLLQCFWNYLSNKVAKTSFMASFEFKFYIAWAIAGIIIFPILQWYYKNSEILRETVPLLAYSLEVLIVSALGIRSHKRFKRLLINFRTITQGDAIVERLAYFQEMNILLTVVLLGYGMSLAILCVDGLTEATIIARNKFATDTLMANCNTCAALIWIIAVRGLINIFIFHSGRSIDRSEAMNHDFFEHRVEQNNNNFPVELLTLNSIDKNKFQSGVECVSLVNNDKSKSISNNDTVLTKPSIREHHQHTFEEKETSLEFNGIKFLRPMFSVAVSSTHSSSIYEVKMQSRATPTMESLNKNTRGYSYDGTYRSMTPVSTYSSYGLKLPQRSPQIVNSVANSNSVDSYAIDWLKQSPHRKEI